VYTGGLTFISESSSAMIKSVILPKFSEWSIRYLPAEIIGSAAAFASAFCIHAATNSLMAAAIAGSIAETIGFYGYFAIRDGARHYARHSAHPRPRRMLLTSLRTVRDMLIEFGPAEAVDSLFIRPFFMYTGPHILHNFGGGLLAGKLTADLIFYTIAASGYELRKYWRAAQKTDFSDSTTRTDEPV
jgi:hypothetical protein